MKSWLTKLALILAASLPYSTTHAWFMQPAMAQQCTFKSWNTGTGQSSSSAGSIGISYDGNIILTSNGVASSKMWRSTNGGSTWAQVGSNQNWSTIALTPDGTKALAGVYGGNLYTSTDGGTIWTSRNSSRNWTGTALSDNGTKMVAAGISTNIYTSTDSGVNWTSRATSRNWWPVTSSSDGTKLAIVVTLGGNIYTSTDSGANWTSRATSQNWKNIASSDDGTNLIATAADNKVYTSTDSGVTWTAVTDLGGGTWRYAAITPDGGTMVVVSSGASGRLYRSTDGGNTWWWLNSLPDADYAAVAISGDGSTIAASVTSGYIYTANCLNTNKHDNSATDDSGMGDCAGTIYGGYCWYKSAANASCDTACATHGSCNLDGTLNYTGSAGTAANCRQVMGALNGTTYGSNSTGSGPGGCNINGSTLYFTTSTATTCAGTTSGASRACACTQ